MSHAQHQAMTWPVKRCILVGLHNCENFSLTHGKFLNVVCAVRPFSSFQSAALLLITLQVVCLSISPR